NSRGWPELRGPRRARLRAGVQGGAPRRRPEATSVITRSWRGTGVGLLRPGPAMVLKPLLPPLPRTQGEEVREQTIRAGHAVRQLTVKRVGEIRVLPFPVRRLQPAAALGRLAAVPRGNDGCVARIPGRPELAAALLPPAFEIRGCDPVRRGEHRQIGCEDVDRRIFFGHFLGGCRQL